MMPGTRPVRFGRIDAVLIVMAGVGVAYVALKIGSVLNYDWRWAALPRFFLRWDDETGSFVPNLLLLGLMATVRLSIWGGLVALAAGLAIGGMRLSPALGLRLIGATYVGVIRNIPPLVFVFIVYFFLSTQLVEAIGLETTVRSLGPTALGIVAVLFGAPSQLSSFLPGMLALGLFSGAYVAEVLRGGVQSIEAGQWEASRSLGLGRLTMLRRVILPQALPRMIGPLSNEFILLVKFSSLASLVSVPELTFQAYQVGVSTRSMFEVWVVVAGLYFVLSAGLAHLFTRLERRSPLLGR